MTPRENAIGIYMRGIRDGDPHGAVSHTGARYTQHSTGVPDGQEGFIAFFGEFLARNPQREMEVLLALQDGRHVFLQVFQSLNDGAAEWVTADFFDSDAEGKIIEHWDVIAAHTPPNPSGRTLIDGPRDITDLDRTAANKALVRAYIETCLIGRDTARLEDFVAPDLAQHSPQLGDGLEAFRAFYAAPDCPLSYQECFMMVGEGNFVATLNRARSGTQDLCHCDLYRIENGRIAEHWDVSEPVPPREDWVNSGKF